MALSHGEKSGPGIPPVYVYLGHLEKTGFCVKGPDGQVEVYPELTGILVDFKTRIELTGEAAKMYKDRGIAPNKMVIDEAFQRDKPEELHEVVVARFRDTEPNQPDIVLSFPVTDSLGGKILGMLNAVRMSERLQDPITLFAFYRAPNTRYNDSAKGKSSVNAVYTGDERIRNNYIEAVYMDESGAEVYRNAEGLSIPPMGKELVLGKKKVWDFSERDAVLSGTAVVLALDYYQKKQAPTDTNQSAQDAGDDGINLDEAAAAAAPGAH